MHVLNCWTSFIYNRDWCLKNPKTLHYQWTGESDSITDNSCLITSSAACPNVHPKCFQDNNQESYSLFRGRGRHGHKMEVGVGDGFFLFFFQLVYHTYFTPVVFHYSFTDDNACNITTTFECHNSVCIGLEDVCDGTEQCPYGSDERYCGKD